MSRFDTFRPGVILRPILNVGEIYISLGQTINHIAGVVIPVVGGVVWETFGRQYTFLIGVGIAVLTLIAVQWMRTERCARSDAHGASRGTNPGGCGAMSWESLFLEYRF